MASNTIDLNRAEKVTSSLIDVEQQDRYQAKTINNSNRTRLAYLPTFPTISISPNDYLLLANIPGLYVNEHKYLLMIVSSSIFCFVSFYISLLSLLSSLCFLVTRLTSHELSRRQHGAYTLDALEMMNKYKYCNAFSLSQQDADELALRLQAGKSIITFNADRLRGICHYFLGLHEFFRRNVLLDDDVGLNKPTLNSTQMAIVLEFYLQIDGLFSVSICPLCAESNSFFFDIFQWIYSL